MQIVALAGGVGGARFIRGLLSHLDQTDPNSSVTVVVNTSAGSAQSPADFAAIANQTLTFSGTTTTQNVTVQVVGDTLDETNETFNVTLSNPTNATLADGTALGTITDDDNPPTVSIGDVSQPEGNAATTNFIFTVTLSSASGQQILVPVSTSVCEFSCGSILPVLFLK